MRFVPVFFVWFWLGLCGVVVFGFAGGVWFCWFGGEVCCDWLRCDVCFVGVFECVYMVL